MKMNLKVSESIENKDLLDRCRLGDQKAQMQIYKLYYKAMYNTSLKILNNTQEAEDIMQEAFLKAFRLLPEISLDSGFGGWLKKMVVNMSLDVIRKRKLKFEQVEEIKDDRIDESTTEFDGENVTDAINRVKRAMNQLPDKYRTVLSLNLFEGYDHDEISNLLGITSSTSRAQVSRGKKKLLSILNS